MKSAPKLGTAVAASLGAGALAFVMAWNAPAPGVGDQGSPLPSLLALVVGACAARVLIEFAFVHIRVSPAIATALRLAGWVALLALWGLVQDWGGSRDGSLLALAALTVAGR